MEQMIINAINLQKAIEEKSNFDLQSELKKVRKQKAILNLFTYSFIVVVVLGIISLR